MSWRDRAINLDDEKKSEGGWRDRALSPDELKKMKAGEVSGAESFARGAGQGLTFGFQDEASSALETLIGKATDVFRGEDEKLYGDSFVQEYRDNRDVHREDNREAREVNPWTFGAGEVTGGALTAVLPGAGLSKSGKLLSNVGMAAGQGALYGAGVSEGETIGEIGKDAAIGGVVAGGVAGTLGGVMALRAARSAKNVKQIDKILDRFQVNDPIVRSRIKKNPEKIKELVDKGVDFDALALKINKEIKDIQNKLGEQIGHFKKSAFRNDTQKIKVPTSLRKKMAEAEGIMKLGDKDLIPKKVRDSLNLVKSVFKGDEVSVSDSIKLVSYLDDIMNAGSAPNLGSTAINEAGDSLYAARTILKDRVRKATKNGAYWAKLDDKYSKLKDVSKGLETRLTNDNRIGFVEGLMREKKSTIRNRVTESLNILDEKNAQRFFEEAEDMYAASQIRPTLRGSIDPKADRLRDLTEKMSEDFGNVFMGIGGAASLPAGPAGVVPVGYASKQLGKRVGRSFAERYYDPNKIFDTALTSNLSKGQENVVARGFTTQGQVNVVPRAITTKGQENVVRAITNSPEMAKRYGQSLAAAAQRGGNALAVRSYVIGKQDPEFRELMNKDDTAEGF